MRTAFIGLCLSIGFSASSQQINMERLKKNHHNLEKIPGTQMPNGNWRLNRPSTTIVGAQPPHYFFDGKTPGVHSLPLDNMPCMVPDTKNIAAIPNPGLNYKHPIVGRIPHKAAIRIWPVVATPDAK